MTLRWIAVPPAALSGEGLVPYRPGEIGDLFDWAEDPSAGSTHVMAHAGEFLLDVVAIERNAVHQPCKPDDEIVFVASGTLQLTSDDESDGEDAGGSCLSIAAGEMVFIPRGWAGLYRVEPGAGRFVEVAVVPHDYFDASVPRTRTAALPRKIELPQAPGSEGRWGRYRLVAHNAQTVEGRGIARDHDTLLRVAKGRLTLGTETLGSEQSRESFGEGRFVVLPSGFGGEIAVSPDFAGFSLTFDPAEPTP